MRRKVSFEKGAAWELLFLAVAAVVASLPLPVQLIGAAVLAIVGIIAYRSRRRTRLAELRRQQGLCVVCGYDLRGGGAICPECGTPAATQSGRSASC
jgi:hypothetical protein